MDHSLQTPGQPHGCLRDRATKIIATLGPGTANPQGIRSLFETGVDVFRLNFSHGSHQDHQRTINHIRNLEKEFDRPIAILADLQGPKLRIGTMEEGVILEKDQTFSLSLSPHVGDRTGASLSHPEIYQAIKEGHRLLLDDGRIVLRITSINENVIKTVVEVAGPLSSCKGVNVPDVQLPIPALTHKDKEDLAFALDQGLDLFALSFVQTAKDIADLRKTANQPIRIIAKIEKPAAMEGLSKIISQADGIMVARGDLGVELSPDQVPIAQRKIIEECRNHGKPVVVATQMLESMIDAPTPTRAEASDVASAVYAGVDAVMLSAETAVGRFPIETLMMMDSIIKRVENDKPDQIIQVSSTRNDKAISFAVSRSVKELSQSLSCHKIATFTTSGSTAVSIARERPKANIFGITADHQTARFLNLVWGIESVWTQDARNFDEMVDIVRNTVQEKRLAEIGETVIITAGVPFGKPGSTNVIRVEVV